MVTINNDPNVGCPNANWNGISANYCTGVASDDIVAHEWAHAYTEHTSGLIYAWQAGAMNEAYSDIWGETVDQLNGYFDNAESNALRNGCASSAKWQIGEQASAFGGALGICGILLATTILESFRSAILVCIQRQWWCTHEFRDS
jgi:hypothetical protein